MIDLFIFISQFMMINNNIEFKLNNTPGDVLFSYYRFI